MFDDDCPPVAAGLDTACGLPSDIRLRLVLVLGATTTTRPLLQTGLDTLATPWLPLPACCSLPHAMDTSPSSPDSGWYEGSFMSVENATANCTTSHPCRCILQDYRTSGCSSMNQSDGRRSITLYSGLEQQMGMQQITNSNSMMLDRLIYFGLPL